jgi:Iron/manganese superoxide dismutases, C-terminal domain
VGRPGGGGDATGDVAGAISEAFGDFNAFKEKLNSTAANRFGSGWAWPVVDSAKLDVIGLRVSSERRCRRTSTSTAAMPSRQSSDTNTRVADAAERARPSVGAAPAPHLYPQPVQMALNRGDAGLVQLGPDRL